METPFYTPPKSSIIMRFLWSAAGADRTILEKSTYSDQVKYMCLGGIIVATGVMAALAGGYAFYTIFSPKGSALETETSLVATISSVIFGILWGLMIFNLDRFIVSSTGKGDGTEAITWQEFKGAIPRIIMGAIIALTISKPIEIRMFKSEIDIKLREEQSKQQAEYSKQTDENFKGRELQLKLEFAKIDSNRTLLFKKIQEYDGKYQNEVTDGNGQRTKGEGPVALVLKGEREKAEKELENFDVYNKTDIEQLSARKRNLLKEKEKERAEGEVKSHGLDGLLERIKLAHHIAGFWISLFVTLLFMAIELTPIFFKLMLVKSPYDFMKDNIEERIKAENGIYVEYNYHKDKNGQERDLVIFLDSEKLILEKKEVQKAQKELTEYAISKYKEDMKKKIDENPSAFIKVQDNI
jgi:hypothetical protein